MKKLLFILLFFGYNCTLVDAQNLDKKGAIKTKTGFLLYFNDENNSYTLNLSGDVDLANFPLVKYNNDYFQLITYPKNKFGVTQEMALTNYYNWEHDYQEDEIFKQKIKVERYLSSQDNLKLQYWNFALPKDPMIYQPVLKTCYLDFVHGEKLYSFSFSSMDGDVKKANNILNGLFKSLQFYDNPIDIMKLREQVMNEKNLQ